ncbi:MAG: peptidylprolyl isomerase [Ferruginibacter sp.]
MIETHKLLPLIALVILVMFFVLACNQQKRTEPHVIINSQLGEIEIELYPAKAPKTVAAFLSNVDAGVYNNTSFYRVLKADEMPTDHNTGLIQGGVYKTNPGIEKTAIPHESTTESGLSHTSGTISMARTEPGTATTEFFICIGDQSSLDAGASGTPDGQGFAAFGKVVKGMSIVRKIQQQSSHGDAFDEQILISSIRLLK